MRAEKRVLRWNQRLRRQNRRARDLSKKYVRGLSKTYGPAKIMQRTLGLFGQDGRGVHELPGLLQQNGRLSLSIVSNKNKKHNTHTYYEIAVFYYAALPQNKQMYILGTRVRRRKRLSRIRRRIRMHGTNHSGQQEIHQVRI